MLNLSSTYKKISMLSINLLIATFSTQSISATLDSTLDNKIDSTLFENFQFSKDFLDQSYLKGNNAASPELIKSLINNGVKLYRAGKHSEGLNELKKAWELAPKMPSTGVTLAMFYIENKQFKEALDIAKQQKNLFPNRSFYSYMIEGFAFVGLNEIEKAKKSFKLALEEKPGDPTTSQALAALAIKEKNIPQAKKYYLNALEIHPENLRSIAQLARIDDTPAHKNKIDNLIKYAKQSAANTVATHIQFARLHYFLKNYPQALHEIQEALKLQPDNNALKFELSKFLILNNQYDAAQKELKNLAKSHPEKPQPLELLGRIALAQKRPDDAVSYFQKALNLSDSTPLAMQLSTAQIRAGQQDAGLETLRNQLAKQPSNIFLHNWFAEQLRKQGKLNEAIQEYEKILQQQPANNAGLRNNLAWTLNTQGQTDKALVQIKQAYEMEPDNPAIMDTYGVILMSNGQYKTALPMFENALKQHPENATILFHFAQALAKTDQKPKALATLNKLLKQSTAFPERQQAEQLARQLQESN